MLMLSCFLKFLFIYLFIVVEEQEDSGEDAIFEVLGRASYSESLCHIALDFFTGGGVLSVSFLVSSLTISSSIISLSLHLALGNLTGEPIETDCSNLQNPSMSWTHQCPPMQQISWRREGLSGDLLLLLDFEIRVSRPLSKSSKDIIRN